MTDDLRVQDQLRGQMMSRLLQKGVRRQDWASSDFFAPFKDEYTEEDFSTLFDDMARWLSDEGYIRFQDSLGGEGSEEAQVFGVQPTSRANQLLDIQIPDTNKTARELSQTTGDAKTDASNWAKLGEFFGRFLGGYLAAQQ